MVVLLSQRSTNTHTCICVCLFAIYPSLSVFYCLFPAVFRWCPLKSVCPLVPQICTCSVNLRDSNLTPETFLIFYLQEAGLHQPKTQNHDMFPYLTIVSQSLLFAGLPDSAQPQTDGLSFLLVDNISAFFNVLTFRDTGFRVVLRQVYGLIWHVHKR